MSILITYSIFLIRYWFIIFIVQEVNIAQWQIIGQWR